MTIALSRLDLNEANPLHRTPPRPPEHRQPDYDEKFDSLSVLYDCFMAPDGRHAVCMGPPLSNLQPVVAPAIARAFKRGYFVRTRVRQLDRHMQIWVVPRTMTATVDGGLFNQQELTVQPNHCDWFRGMRVLTTASQNNDLVWIRDWITFHVANHGCNAVLIYDNASTRYNTADLRNAISSIKGLDRAVVVDWPYKFGPVGGPAGLWDSDFCQYGSLEHAHLRFLASAEAVINADVDELIVTAERESIFDIVARSKTGYLRYEGIAVENATEQNDGMDIRHSHYVYNETPPRVTNAKWTVDPSRCHPHSQWCVHKIRVKMRSDVLSARVRYRHFMAITTNWETQRGKLERPGPGHQLDEELVRCLACIQ